MAATGGVAGWAAHKTVRIKLEISLQGMGMGGPAERFQTNRNGADRHRPARHGDDPRRLERQGAVGAGSHQRHAAARGAEAEQARIEAAWNTDLQAHELFPKIEPAAIHRPGSSVW